MDSFLQEGFDSAHRLVVKGAALRFPLRVLWKYPCESLADWEPAPATKYSKKKARRGPLLRSSCPPFIDGERVVFTDGGIFEAVDSSASAPATFHCLNATTGEKLWSRLHDLPGLLEIAGVAAGSMIVHRWWEERPSLRVIGVVNALSVEVKSAFWQDELEDIACVAKMGGVLSYVQVRTRDLMLAKQAG